MVYFLSKLISSMKNCEYMELQILEAKKSNEHKSSVIDFTHNYIKFEM
jgi:hypothetical protein